MLRGMTKPDELLSITAAAKKIGRHRETLRRWMDAGLVPFHTEGMRRYVLSSECDKIIEARKAGHLA